MAEPVVLVEADLRGTMKLTAYWTLDGKVKWFLGLPVPTHPGSFLQNEIDVAHATALLLSVRS